MEHLFTVQNIVEVHSNTKQQNTVNIHM